MLVVLCQVIMWIECSEVLKAKSAHIPQGRYAERDQLVDKP